MLVSEVITHCGEIFNNPMTANDDITPTMVIYWINKTITDYWRKMVDQQFGYFQIKEAVLSITAGTSVYALPNASTTSATTSASVAWITNMFLRIGSGQPYTYLNIPPTYPTDRFYLKQSSILFPVSTVLLNQAGFTWCSNVGNLDGSGNPTWNIEFSPTPGLSGSCVYDGYRYPAAVAATTDHLDIPDHMAHGVILHVLKMCYFRDKADLSEINQEIENYDKDIFAFEKRGIQQDGPLIVKEVR